MTAISTAFPIFNDIDGQPLEAGYVWIGLQNLDPVTNQQQVYWDQALTQLATQPIRTRGGYPLNGVAIGQLYTAPNYSIKVTNRNGSVLYNDLFVSSDGFIMRTDYPNNTAYLAAASTLSTGGFWLDELPQPRFWRFADRVFIGEAASQSTGTKFPIPGEGTFLTTQMGADWMERGATTLSVAPQGEFGGVFAARTSDKSAGGYYGTATIGVLGIVENDDTSVNQTIGWAGYFEANRGTNNKVVFGLEISIKNKGDNKTSNPYSVDYGTTGIWLPAGGDASYNGVNANPCATAIMIGRGDDQGNPALPMSWNRGIIFNAKSITGTDGVTGTGIAIDLAKGHVIRWATPLGQNGAAIYSQADDTAKAQTIVFANDQIQFLDNSQGFTAIISKGTGVANQIRLFSEATGTAPRVQAEGIDTNVDLYLQPKGTGRVQYGVHTGTADAPISGYIEIKDAGGTVRKLAVIS
jgi:hypothetical protein